MDKPPRIPVDDIGMYGGNAAHRKAALFSIGDVFTAGNWAFTQASAAGSQDHDFGWKEGSEVDCGYGLGKGMGAVYRIGFK